MTHPRPFPANALARRPANALARDVARGPAARALVAGALLLACLLGGAGTRVASAAPAPNADSVKLVEEANRKLRQRDTSGALDLLRRAIAADSTNIDAHIRYQDIAAPELGRSSVQGSYVEAARTRTTDPVAQFLAARLLPASQAVEEFQKQAKTFADSPWPCAGLARALEDTGRAADAATAHSDAIRRAGADAPRFLAYRAYGLERASQWDPAAEAWTAVIAKSPGDLSARLGLAEALRKAGRTDEALSALDDAAKAAAPNAEVAYRRGLALLDQEKLDEALAQFDEAVKRDGSMVEALCAASEAARYRAYVVADKEARDLNEKDFERSVAYGERAVVASQDNGYAYYVLGAANEAQGEFDADRLDEAVQAYDKALERMPIPGPDKVRTYTAKSWVLLQKANFDGALEAAQRALDIDRECAVAWGHAGYALTAQGRAKDAIEKYYKPGLKIVPGSARLHHDLGIALWEMKKPNDARKPLEEARNLEPENGRFRFTLGVLHYEMKRNKEAVAELSKASELLPRDLATWRAFGRACYAAKNWAECVRAYEHFATLEKDAIDEHLILAVVYSEQLKDKVKAKAHAAKFRERGGQDANLDDWLNTLLATDTK